MRKRFAGLTFRFLKMGVAGIHYLPWQPSRVDE
jgi:hypothetical protein